MANLEQPLYMPELSAQVGASYWALDNYCLEYLGMPPKRYLWLRRMNQARRALYNADPDSATVTRRALKWPLNMPELCDLIVVSDRTLRLCCAEFLGMSPTRYVLLRRLKEVRRTLRDAPPDTLKVAEVAHRFGFAKLGRFAGRYRAIFGETPTLQRIPAVRFAIP